MSYSGSDGSSQGSYSASTSGRPSKSDINRSYSSKATKVSDTNSDQDVVNIGKTNQNGQVETSADGEDPRDSVQVEISVGDETSIAESLGLIREASLEVSKSEAMPYSETEVLNSSPIGDQPEESQEKNKGSVDDEMDVAPEEENLKPPPLAGENVMNVILVAAECAPWSKTGNHFF